MHDAAMSVLKLSSAMARYASHSHSITARNIAHADIPDAQRLQITDFQESVRRLGRGEVPRASIGREAISLETEMLAMAEARESHGAALRIWKTSLNMMRLAVGGPQG